MPPTAQVVYQQGAVIAHNLKALALANKLKLSEVSLRGTLLKLRLGSSVANIFNRHLNPNDGVKTAVRAMEVVGGIVGVLVARKLLQALGNDKRKHNF